MQNDCYPGSPHEWPKVPLGALAELNPRYPVRKGVDYPFIEMAAVGENFGGILSMDRRRLEGSGLARFKLNDTLFAKITPCPENGKVAFVGALPGEVGLGSTEFIVLSPREGTDPRFLYHLACSHALRGRAVARMEGSTGRQRVPLDAFDSRLLVPNPSPDEQAAISGVLDALDLAIDRAREAMAAQKALRDSLVIELLSSGVGRGGRIRNATKERSEFQSTLLGRLPRDWRLSDIKTEFRLQNGITLNEAQRSRRPKWRYLRVANVQRDALALEDVQLLEATEAEVASRLLKQGDLLVVEGHADRMQIGRCALVTTSAVGMTFQNHLFRLRSNGDVMPAFGCLWLNSWQSQRYWNAMCATSSGLNTINQRMLKRLRIPVPPPGEQAQIVEIASASKERVAALAAKLASLQQLKKSLMHDLLTGTVRIDPAILQEQEA